MIGSDSTAQVQKGLRQGSNRWEVHLASTPEVALRRAAGLAKERCVHDRG